MVQMAQNSPLLESRTKFSFENSSRQKPLGENTFFQWTNSNFYRTSYNDMSDRVSWFENSYNFCLIFRLNNLPPFSKNFVCVKFANRFSFCFFLESITSQVLRDSGLPRLRAPNQSQQRVLGQASQWTGPWCAQARSARREEVTLCHNRL